MPSRRPSWLPRVEPLIQESVVDLPASSSVIPISSEPREAIAAELTMAGRAREGQAQRAQAVIPPEPEWVSKGQSLDPSLSFPKPGNAQFSSVSADSQSVHPAPPAMRPRNSTRVSSADLDQHSVEPDRRVDLETRTLQSVLAEIGRRQKELELQYQTQPTVPAEQFGGERASSQKQSRAPDGVDDVRLNIGSIVVQVEPPPAVTATSQVPERHLRPPRPDGDTRRWARSFLDR